MEFFISLYSGFPDLCKAKSDKNCHGCNMPLKLLGLHQGTGHVQYHPPFTKVGLIMSLQQSHAQSCLHDDLLGCSVFCSVEVPCTFAEAEYYKMTQPCLKDLLRLWNLTGSLHC